MTTYKKALFNSALVLGVLAITVIAIEAASCIFLYAENGHWNSKAEIQATLQKTTENSGNDKDITAQDRSPSFMQQHVLHPYLGFVLNSDIEQPRYGGHIAEEQINSFGFWGPEPATSLSQDTYVIGITGGSVAAEFYFKGRERLATLLTEKGLFKDRKIMFVSFGLGGMKQPQQSLALNYLLSTGRHFDAVINIDGFNEVVLPITENAPYKVNPFYPRHWRLYAAKSVDPATIVLSGKISISNQKMDAWSRKLARFPYRESYAVLALWQQFHNRMKMHQYQLEEQLQQQLSKDGHLSAQESGPKYEYVTPESLMEDAASTWQASSKHMWALCKENSIDYYHFLQPNQYVPDTHTPTDWERTHIIGGSDYSYRKGAEAGYPALQIAGNLLIEYGVPFTDLTPIFKNEPRTVYRDACCHYNQLGNEILADSIAVAMEASQTSKFAH